MRSRLLLLTTVLAAAAVSAAASASPAAADPPPTPPPAWVTASVPLPTAPNGDLEAVSCAPGVDYCVEVGAFHDATGQQQPLAAHRTGTTWKRDTLPPVSTPSVRLTAVSCVSASACVAVGITGNGVGDRDDHPIAYSWNGSRWTKSAPALPAGSTIGRLTGVSCGSATDCLAVGESERADGGRVSLSYRYDGAHWTARPVPIVDDSGDLPSEGLHAVSCPTTTFCTAVGNSGDPAGIIQVWNGSTWNAQSPAAAPGAWIGELDGVSCVSTTVCTAVGYLYDGGDTDLAQAQRLTSGHWVRDTVPSTLTSFTAISCPASVCVTVATRQVGQKFDTGVATRNAAGAWSFTSLPTPGDFASLTGVWCTAKNACTAVGNGDLPFVDRLVGSTWTGEPTVAPRGVNGSRLDGVSCTTATACTAVGRYNTSSQALALVERWDGSAWTQQSVPDRAGEAFTEFLDVSCPTVSFCVAGGESDFDSTGVGVPEPLLARWTAADGWSTVPSPSPAGTEGSVNAVSCASATSCVAVGFTYGGNGALSYVLRGTTWTAQKVALPSGVRGVSLSGVSCTTSTSCHAVGEGYTNTGAVQHVDVVWNGSAWSAGPAVGKVDAVSCPAASTCTAVGTADDGDQQVVVQRLSGGTWTSQSTPDPDAKLPYLQGVSCTGSICTAVGAADSPLVMRSRAGGAWKIESIVTPPGDGALRDVSCADAAHCVAVGTFGSAGVIETRVVT